MQILKLISRWTLISVIFFIFYTFITLIILVFYIANSELVAFETNQLDSRISSWIDPYGQGFDDYVKNGKNFKLVNRPDRSNDFIVIIKLKKNNFIEIEQEFNRRNIDNSQVSCNQSGYIGLCKIMSADKEANFQIYKINRDSDHDVDEVFWVLYKDKEKLGVFSHIPLPYEFLYKRYMKAFTSELNWTIFDKFFNILSCVFSCLFDLTPKTCQ